MSRKFMGFLDSLSGNNKKEKTDWRKIDYERCGNCGHSKMYHNVMCTRYRNCRNFIPSGQFGMNP